MYVSYTVRVFMQYGFIEIEHCSAAKNSASYLVTRFVLFEGQFERGSFLSLRMRARRKRGRMAGWKGIRGRAGGPSKLFV